MKNHLVAIESGGKAGRRLASVELIEVMKSIKALGAKAKSKERHDLRGKTIGQMLEEAARHPEVAKVIAAMGG